MSERIEFIEIELKKCQLDYGVGACTASVGVTGDQKCFNCRATCQDIASIDEADEIVRYAKASTNVRFDLDATPNLYVPNVQAVDYTPAALDLGESMGLRASLTVSFSDHRSPDTDASGDNYLESRSYDPYEQGTYWGKFRARHPFIRGQSLYWVQGTSEQKVEDMERRQFFIESNTGPDSGGRYTITAKDALRLTDSQRAMAPRISNGYTKTAIASGATSVTLSPTGVGADYPASGKAAIGGVEIVDFTRSGDVFTITRARNNTEATDHDVESQFQLCLVYSGQDPADILFDLLNEYAGLPASFLPLADWLIESDLGLGRLYSSVIATPTPVNVLINEIIQQTASSMFWDPLASLVRWQILKNPSVDAAEYTSREVVDGSYSVADQPGKRVSQVWFWYGQLNPLLNLTDARNYASTLAVPNFESEANFDNVPAIRKVYSRWVLGSARDTAESVASLVLQRYSTPPRKLGFRLLRDSGVSVPTTAGAYTFKNQFLQNADGSAATMPIQVTSVKPSMSYYEVTAEEITFTEIAVADPNIVNVFLNDGDTNVNLLARYLAEKATATASSVLNVYVPEGTTIGSSSTASYAIRTGAWPAGATINLYNSGTIAGRGGNGGNGASASYVASEGTVKTITKNLTAPTPGQSGGDAILVEHNINVYNTGGVIGGGGGGAGGSGAAWADWENITTQAGILFFFYYPTLVNGAGGAGGAGYPAGNGGGNGTRTVVYENGNFGSGIVYSYLFTVSEALVGGKVGLAGSLLAGGGKAGDYYHDNLNPITYLGAAYSIGARVNNDGGAWGVGGGLGQAGQAGDNVAHSFGTVPQNVPSRGTDTLTTNNVNGAAGGAAGNAIVQSGGVANIIETGTILGAIV